MIVDTSAIMVIVRVEAEAERFAGLIRAKHFAISAGTVLEAEIVVRSRFGEAAVHDLRAMMSNARAEIAPVDEQQVRIASDAYARYGRGSGSAAKLNYGDCVSYALAIARDEPLLFKGDDFVHTDVRVAA